MTMIGFVIWRILSSLVPNDEILNAWIPFLVSLSLSCLEPAAQAADDSLITTLAEVKTIIYLLFFFLLSPSSSSHAKINHEWINDCMELLDAPVDNDDDVLMTTTVVHTWLLSVMQTASWWSWSCRCRRWWSCHHRVLMERLDSFEWLNGY